MPLLRAPLAVAAPALAAALALPAPATALPFGADLTPPIPANAPICAQLANTVTEAAVSLPARDGWVTVPVTCRGACRGPRPPAGRWRGGATQRFTVTLRR